MNYQDYLAALDRLRRVKTDEPLSEIYGKPLVCPEDIRTDKATIYDAETRPDTATVEWCREIGFTEGNVGKHRIEIGRVYFVQRFTDNGWSLVIEDTDGEQVVISKRPTRGEVLTVLRLFNERKA